MIMPANSNNVVILDDDKKYELQAPVGQPPSFLAILAEIALEENTAARAKEGNGPSNVFLDITNIVPLTRSGLRVTITFDVEWTASGVDHSELMDAVFVVTL